MNVKSVMTPDPTVCTPQTPLREVAKMMVDQDCGQIPVVMDTKGKKPIGVVTDRDITVRTVAQGRNPLDSTAGDVMSTPALTVRCDNSLDECLKVMEDNKVRRVPVVDETGAICGIVSLADVARSAKSRDTLEVVKEVSEPR